MTRQFVSSRASRRQGRNESYSLGAGNFHGNQIGTPHYRHIQTETGNRQCAKIHVRRFPAAAGPSRRPKPHDPTQPKKYCENGVPCTWNLARSGQDHWTMDTHTRRFLPRVCRSRRTPLQYRYGNTERLQAGPVRKCALESGFHDIRPHFLYLPNLINSKSHESSPVPAGPVIRNIQE